MSATRKSARRFVIDAGRQSLVRIAGIARSRLLPALGAARATTWRAIRTRAAPLLAALRSRRPDRRSVAVALASSIFVMALSAGVVASRDNARTRSPEVAMAAPAGTGATMTRAATGAPAPISTAPEAPAHPPRLSPSSAAPASAAPTETRAVAEPARHSSRHRRRHAAAHPSPAHGGRTPAVPAARPTFSR